MNDKKDNINPIEKPINNLINEIDRLINLTSKEYENQKKILNFLYEQIKKARNLKEYSANPQLLNAFLTLQGFYYRTEFDCAKLTERLAKGVELIRREIEPEPRELQQIPYEQLERELARRNKLAEEALRKYEIKKNPI